MTASAKVLRMDGSEVGSLELNDAIFGMAMNETMVHDTAVALRNAKRQGNAETKTRREVRGGGRKPYRQKGTGSARRGSTREPHMRGGGVVFGPHKRSYRQKVPVAIKRKALCCMLSDRARSGALCVLDALRIEAPKTKPFAEMLSHVSPEGKRTLFVTAETARATMLSARNVPKVSIATASDVNALDVLEAAQIVIVQDALAKLEDRLL